MSELQDAYEEIRRLAHELGLEKERNLLALARIDGLNQQVNRGVIAHRAMRDQVDAAERERRDAETEVEALKYELQQYRRVA